MGKYLIKDNEWNGVAFLQDTTENTLFQDLLDQLKVEFDKNISFKCKVVILDHINKARREFELFNYEYDDCYKNYLEDYMNKPITQFTTIELFDDRKPIDLISFELNRSISPFRAINQLFP